MEERRIIIFFIEIFLVTQFLGLYAGSEYIKLIRAGEAYPVFENPESVENSVFLVLYMLVITGIMILIIKYKRVFLKGIEAAAVFFASSYAFYLLLPKLDLFVILSLFLALALTAWKMLRPNFLNQNLALILSVAGAGAVIGVSLGIVPVLIFVLFLSVYDFISVFVTKHMVYIAKEISKTPTAFTAAIPHKFKKAVHFTLGKKKVKRKFHVFQLGGGDIAIPLIFSVSVLNTLTPLHALLTVFGSVIALFFSIYFVLKKPGTVLPALPWISSGMLAGFLVSVILF